jgi:hypothetical protein
MVCAVEINLLNQSTYKQVHLRPSCQAAVETEKLALMRRELLECRELRDAPPEVIERLHLLWQNVQVRKTFLLLSMKHQKL